MTRWRYAAATDIGLVRRTNQDAVYVDGDLAVVADGMGGHAAGDVAAQIAVETVREGYRADESVEGLVAAVERANAAVVRDAKANPERFGMGTTLLAVAITYDYSGAASPTLVHVGDSRAYQLRDGALRQLTHDHSVAEEWVRLGRLTPEEAEVHPRRHQLTRGVGVEEEVAVDVLSIDAQVGDRILLCSDGLSNELVPDELARLAGDPVDLDHAVRGLVAAARAAGGHDNISVVLLEFDEVTPAATPIHRTVTSAPPPAPALGRTKDGAHPRRFSARALLGVVAFAGVAAGVVALTHWYAYSSYYLADYQGAVVIYQGQPSGVLWYRPILLEATPYSMAELRPLDQRAVRATIPEPTLDAARAYAKNLFHEWRLGVASTTTTTKSSTSSTTTTTGKG
ncbi:MAG: PP2C family protein-serine/threonine phosphatase [Acidimicrobiales bacterium]